LTAAADEKCVQLLASRYPGLAPLGEHPERALRVVSSLNAESIEHLKKGGDVLMLGTEPFPVNKGYNSFRSGLGDKPEANLGTVIAKHPIFADLPNEGWADWHFYYVLDGAWPFIIDEVAMGGFSPILEVISPPSHVRKQAVIFERRVGKGRLLASSCANHLDNPASVALLDGMMRYVSSDQFHPAIGLELDPEILADNAAERPKDAKNHVPESSFDRRKDVAFIWQSYGGGFALDREVAHQGRGSMRLQISPEQLKANPKISVGASTIINKFGDYQRLRLAAWCRSDKISGELDGDFQIYTFLNYADGTRETVKMPLPVGTHDWQLVETLCHPKKELNPDQSPMLYITMSGKSGTAWLDDLYLGPVPEGN
jgi:hypothetical protein